MGLLPCVQGPRREAGVAVDLEDAKEAEDAIGSAAVVVQAGSFFLNRPHGAVSHR